MKRFRYDTTGNWYKGNTHVHSVVSDGGKTFAELADMYAGEGYSFLFRTDHDVVSNVAGDPAEYPLLWLDGVEFGSVDDEGGHFHFVCLGMDTAIAGAPGMRGLVDAARRQNAIVILSHPSWMNNNMQDALRYEFDGVEIYNDLCRWINGRTDGLSHWNAMLCRNPDTLAFAADDTHATEYHHSWNGGWIVINAPECTTESVMTAIRTGNFYSSTGPEIHAIEEADGILTLRTSPVRTVRLATSSMDWAREGSPTDDLITEISIPLREDWDYIYVDVEDDQRRRAWTNTLFVGESAR